jgi:Raf kinase inhibitor-like YbhB/YbcL family protein
MPSKLRALAIGSSVLLALSVTGVAVSSAAHATTARPAARHAAATHRDGAGAFTVTSPDFAEYGWLPVSSEFGGPGSAGSGCSGANQAPTLHWTNVPAGTESFAFTITDVDAPQADFFHHWIVYNIPAGVTTLQGHGSNPYSEGTNDWPTVGYGGPCPPADGQIHHYVFTVWALSVPSISGTHLTYSQLMSAISNDIVGATSTIGLFRLPLGS